HARDVVPGERVAGHSVARHGVSRRLQDDRPGEHYRRDAARSRRHRTRQRTPLRLRGQSAGACRRPRGHTMRDVPRGPDRAVRLLHPQLSHHARRTLSVVPQRGAGTLELELRRADRLASFHSRQPPIYNSQLPMNELKDLYARPLHNLRLSVTDRCNLRCEYCMPEDDYVRLPREDVLHFEEITRVVDVFIFLGVDKVRLTGGEPLLRRDIPSLVRMLGAKSGLADLALTTN